MNSKYVYFVSTLYNGDINEKHFYPVFKKEDVVNSIQRMYFVFNSRSESLTDKEHKLLDHYEDIFKEIFEEFEK